MERAVVPQSGQTTPSTGFPQYKAQGTSHKAQGSSHKAKNQNLQIEATVEIFL